MTVEMYRGPGVRQVVVSGEDSDPIVCDHVWPGSTEVAGECEPCAMDCCPECLSAHQAYCQPQKPRYQMVNRNRSGNLIHTVGRCFKCGNLQADGSWFLGGIGWVVVCIADCSSR